MLSFKFQCASITPTFSYKELLAVNFIHCIHLSIYSYSFLSYLFHLFICFKSHVVIIVDLCSVSSIKTDNVIVLLDQ